MNNEDRCFCELAPLYVLDLLDESSRAWVEHQTAASPELAAELAELQATVGAISYGALTVPVPIDLKDRLFQRLNQPLSEAELIDTAPSGTIAPLTSTELPLTPARLHVVERPGARATRSRKGMWLQAGGAIAALAVIALMVDNYRLRQINQDDKAIISTLQQPDSILYTLRGTKDAAAASGSLVVNPRQNAVTVLVQNLPELPSGQAYRLWAMPKGATKPTYCGQFNSRSNNPTTQSWVPPESICNTTVAQMLITAESAIAPPVPAGPLVMKSTL